MRCAHDGCTCQVAESEMYCSDYCREHEAHAEPMACECGHPECEGTQRSMQ